MDAEENAECPANTEAAEAADLTRNGRDCAACVQGCETNVADWWQGCIAAACESLAIPAFVFDGDGTAYIHKRS